MYSAFGGALLTAGLACQSDSAIAPESKPTFTVEAVTAPAIEGIVGHAVAPTPAVQVKDRLGHPVAGVAVDFSDRYGSISSPNTVTDQAGMASPGQWILGTRAGLNTLSVMIDGVVVLRFTVTGRADHPAFLSKLFSNEEVLLPGESVTDIAVEVGDRWGNPVPTDTVAFSLTGAGALSETETLTGPNGIARLAEWTPDMTPGLYSLIARTAGTDSVVFTARTLDAAGMTWYALDSIAAGSKRYAPEDFYVREAELGLSSSGYFVEKITYTDLAGGKTHSEGGSYSESNSILMLFLRGSTETARRDGALLMIDRTDEDVGQVTWIYKLRQQ